MKRFLAGLLVFVMMFSLVGCGGESAAEENASGEAEGSEVASEEVEKEVFNELHLGYDLSWTQTLDIMFETHGETNLTAAQIAQPLIGQNASTGEMYPLLLTKMPEYDEDSLTYSFELRDGVKFHDGSALDSDDVIASICRIYNPENPSSWQAMIGFDILGSEEYSMGEADVIEGLKKIDNTHFEVVSTSNNVVFIQHFAAPGVVIYPSDLDESTWGTEVYIGTGPFKLESFEPGSRVVLSKNEDYYSDEPEIDQIVIDHMVNETALLEFEAGSIDFVLSLPDDSVIIDTYRNDPVFSDMLLEFVQPGVVALSLNTSFEPTSNVKVREAIDAAINREEIANKLFGGIVEPAYGLIPPGVLGSTDDYPNLYDPEKAKALLEEAGYPDGIELTWTLGNTDDTKIAEYLQQDFKKSNISINIEIVDTAALSDLRGSHQILKFGWIGVTDPSDYAHLYSSVVAAIISSYYTDETTDEWIAQGKLIFDEAERDAFYKDMEQKLIKEAFMYLPMFHPKGYSLVSDRLSDVDVNDYNKIFLNAKVAE